MSSSFPAFAELITQTRHSALHLEMRDVHTPRGPVFVDWQKGRPIESDRHSDWAGPVQDTAGAAATGGARGSCPGR